MLIRPLFCNDFKALEKVSGFIDKREAMSLLGTGNLNRTSTLFAHKGDYLAFREISISYSLPQTIADKLYMQSMNVSVTGQNLGYLTAAPVANPERAYGGGVASGTGYGLPRTLLFGMNVTF